MKGSNLDIFIKIKEINIQIIRSFSIRKIVVIKVVILTHILFFSIFISGTNGIYFLKFNILLF